MLRFKNFSAVTAITLLIITVGALFARLHGLGEYAFSDDELWHLVVADQKSFWDVIQYNFREEVHPPLSFLIWHYMLKISHNDLWLRMSSIIPGLLLIPSVYIFGRLYVGGRAAAYTMALLLAFGAMPIAMSTTIRAYSMMMLALTWTAIFIHKYRFEIDAKQRNKNLVYYFLSALAAIELNHAASFAIFSFGLVLIFQTLKEKNKKDFFVIGAMHVLLGILVVGYIVSLKYFFSFNGIFAIFTDKTFANYLMNYMTLFMWFPIGSEVQDSFTQIVTLISVASLIVTPIALIRARKWTLLNLIFTPLFLLILTDYLRFYPFTGTHRNNLFLFFSVIIIYAYFIQICANFFAKFYPEEWLAGKKNLMFFVQIISASILVIIASNYIIQRQSFRNTNPNCAEFSIKKSDRALLLTKLQEKDSANNIFVTIVRNIWYWRLQHGDENHLKLLTKNLGKFESEGRTIYFTAFPAREFSITQNLQEYKLFFRDLFAQLKSEGKMDKVKSFTFFDIGFNIDYLTRRFHPQFIPRQQDPFMNMEDKTRFKIWQEGYNIGWAINRSDQVLSRFYFKDPAFCCGREIVIFSFTPKFVRDEILNKDFVDARKFEKEFYSK